VNPLAGFALLCSVPVRVAVPSLWTVKLPGDGVKTKSVPMPGSQKA